MATEIAISFSSLRAQLESEKSNLFKIDENIKKIVQTSGRFTNDRFNSSGDYSRGGTRLGGRNSYPDSGNYKNDEQFNKRKHETKTVFSRLSAKVHDSDGEEDGPGVKRARVPSAVCRELPTRAAVLRAQGDDDQTRRRNRRIFGSLLGTLQKFKQEEIGLQTKEEKKAQVERKIEEQARQEKEREQKERKTLFAEREHKKATIKALEAKMARVQEFEKWEASQQCLSNSILTKAKPHIYWLPKKMSEKATEKLSSSRRYHEKYMVKKRQELQEELYRIEQRCLRHRGPNFRDEQENHQSNQAKDNVEIKSEVKEEDKARTRNKFAMDKDEKDDTDGDDNHEGEENKTGEKEKPNDNKTDAENKISGENKIGKQKKYGEDNKIGEENKTDDENTTGKEHKTGEGHTIGEEHKTGEENNTSEEHKSVEKNNTSEENGTGEKNEKGEESKTSKENETNEENKTDEENKTNEENKTSDNLNDGTVDYENSNTHTEGTQDRQGSSPACEEVINEKDMQEAEQTTNVNEMDHP